ncbi:MAG TPA: hypothetical protein VG826_22815 [Pirellulales bacterium]|nr:hypothetical protein [Pirellulales bacterium]
MQTEHFPSPPMRIRPGVILLVVVGGFALLFTVVLAGAWLASHRRLAAELERIRAAGEPASAEDLEAFYKAPPAGRDTTELWLAALAPLDKAEFQAAAKDLPFVGEGPDAIPFPGEPWPQLDPAEQFLSRYVLSLDKMHQASREGGRARFPTRFADGIATRLPHVQQLRAAVRLLQLETAVAAHRGRLDDTTEAVLAMFAAARSLEQEPILVSQFVRMAFTGIARGRVVWLLSAGVLNDSHLKRLDTELSATDYENSFRRALLGERSIGIQTFTDPEPLGSEAPRLPLGLMASSDETLYLQIMREMIAAGELRGSERIRALDQVDTQLKTLAGETTAKFRYPMTLLLVPALSASAEATSRNEADRDATRVAIAIERFRLREGRLPSTTDELVPAYLEELPNDPFVGGSSKLKYRVDAAEYRVYSVGSDGVDDGGVSEPPGSPADIVVRVRIKPEPSSAVHSIP